MLHTKAIGKASIVLGSPSLGTTPPKTDAVFGSIASRRAICRVIRQLRRLGTESVGQQRFHVGSIRVRVGRLGHERVVQGDVDLTPQRMQPVVHRSYGCSREIFSVGLRHLHLHVYHRVGEIYVIVSGTEDEEFYRSSRVQRSRGLMLHHVTGDDAVLSGRHGKEIQLALDSLARLSMHERHCRSLSRFSDVRLSRRLFTAVIVTFADGRFIPLPKATVFMTQHNRMSSSRPRWYCAPTKSGSASPTWRA